MLSRLTTCVLLLSLMSFASGAVPCLAQPASSAKFEFFGELPMLTTSVDNQRFLVLLDSGSDGNYVSGSEPISQDASRSFDVLGVSMRAGSIRQLASILSPDPERRLIILGRPFFDDHIIEFDYGLRRIRTVDAAEFDRVFAEERLGSPSVIVDNQQIIVTGTLRFGDRVHGVPRVLIDTGSNTVFSLAPQLRQQVGFDKAQTRELQQTTIHGVGKYFVTQQRCEFALGSNLLQGVVGWPDRSNLGWDAQVGSGALRDSKVTFAAGRRLVFVNRSDIVTWGLNFKPLSERPLAIAVDRVTDNSPAARSGLQTGDEIKSLNGRALSDMSPGDFRAVWTDTDAKQIVAGVRRSTATGEKRDIVITLTRE